MKKLVYTSVVIFIFGCFSKADGDAFPKDKFEEIYQLNIDSNSTIQSDNAYQILAGNYHDFLYLLLGGTVDSFQVFKERHQMRLGSIESSQSTGKVKSFCQAEIDLQWALLNWRFGEHIKSGILLRRAYKSLIQLQSDYPDFIEVNKSIGLLHILLSAIPPEYEWLINLFGFENNYERGIQELKLCAEKENNFQLEAKLFLSYVNIFVLAKKDVGFKIINDIDPDKYKITSFSYVIFCHKAGENEKGLNEIYKDQWIFAPPLLKPFLSLLRGELHLKKLEFEDAILNYKDFMLSYAGIGFRANTRLKLFYSYYLLGDEDKAKVEMQKNTNTQSQLIVSDNYAKEFFEDEKAPDKVLLKSRLLFDGGYLNQAKAQIDLYPLKSYPDKEFQIEYYYRKARIEQSLNNINLSISAFDKCIELQADGNYYFAPNSCLQLGRIYLDKGKTEKAKYFFSKALEYKKYPYKQSISHQAKSALNALDSQ